MKSIYKITLLLFISPMIIFGNVDHKKQEKSKTIKKEFTVNKDAKVTIDNKYGDLNISTWNKNKVEVEVKITVKGNDIDDVTNSLNKISIDFNTSTSFINIKTQFEKEKSNWSWFKGSKKISYKINYYVKMPETNSVDLNNDYGGIFLENLSGKADINCDYGKIHLGNLTATENNINLDYCSSSTISYIKSGDINIDYSKLTVDNSEDIRANLDYSTLKFGQTNNINFNADYGSVSINEAENIIGNSDYTSMSFGTVKKNLNIDTDYGSISVKRLAKDFKNVTIDGQYAGIRIGVDPDAIFDFELNLQYASFKTDNEKIEFYKKISKTTKKYYEGKYGKGSSNSKINIRSQYGGVTIREN